MVSAIISGERRTVALATNQITSLHVLDQRIEAVLDQILALDGPNLLGDRLEHLKSLIACLLRPLDGQLPCRSTVGVRGVDWIRLVDDLGHGFFPSIGERIHFSSANKTQSDFATFFGMISNVFGDP